MTGSCPRAEPREHHGSANLQHHYIVEALSSRSAGSKVKAALIKPALYIDYGIFFPKDAPWTSTVSSFANILKLTAQHMLDGTIDDLKRRI